MGFIKNFDTLAITPQRKLILDLVEEAFRVIQPKEVLKDSFYIKGTDLFIKGKEFDLKKYKRVFLIGFGKGSAGISKIIEERLGQYLTDGYVIDNVEQEFSKIHFTLGTHPLPSDGNIHFTENVLDKIKDLGSDDLVLVVICGGGSAMFEAPYKIDLPKLTEVFDELLKSGATISDMNVIRKHLSKVKGGGLAKHLYPATVASLLFSDVPGSNLSVIASGPTVMETSTLEDVKKILKQYNITNINLTDDVFTTLAQDEKFFKDVHNILIVSNDVALKSMEMIAKRSGYNVTIFSDRAQGFAKQFGISLIQGVKPHTIVLVGGETTMKVEHTGGKGGRNQALVLSALSVIDDSTTIASFDSDGADFYYFAGAIGDAKTLEKAKKLGLDPQKYLDDDNSYEFWKQTGDGIYTGKLESNVSDLMIVLKD